MKITRAGGYLFQLTRFAAFNCFLVLENDGFTLVDTNITGSARAILGAAAQLGAPIRRIAITHAHDDHVGSLDALHTLLPEAEVLVSARDARFLAGDRSLDATEPQDKLRGGYRVVQTRPSRLLVRGDRIGTLEVIAAPGHTPGHIAFLDSRDGTLIAGDAFQTQGGVGVSGTLVPLFPVSPFTTWHRPTALQTARALRALEPARLAVGHGPTLEQPLAAMDRAIEKTAQRLREKAHHEA